MYHHDNTEGVWALLILLALLFFLVMGAGL